VEYDDCQHSCTYFHQTFSKNPMFSNPPPPEKRAVRERMSKNVVEPERLQVTVWRSVTCWSSKAARAQGRRNM
jgi:hypothetical protein